MSESRTLYVIAGPNGIGKTTSTFDLVPKGIPVINSDEIAKQLRLAGIPDHINTAEFSNREASKLVQENLDKGISFGIETNLCDVDTWKFIIGVQKLGYLIHLIFLSADDLTLLNKRIEERTLRGEHFVLPSVVEERYIAGLKLLSHYFEVPDRLTLIDNSSYAVVIMEKRRNSIELSSPIPRWIDSYLHDNLWPKKQEEELKNLPIDEIRERYKRSSNG